jgi:CheY-like chemotaxis protein
MQALNCAISLDLATPTPNARATLVASHVPRARIALPIEHRLRCHRRAHPSIATTAQPDMPATTPTPSQPDVLVIDGSAASRYRIRQELRALNAQIRQAASVELALPRLRADPPDLIISAPTLPGMNALDLLALLRNDPRAPAVAIRTNGNDWPLGQMATQLGAIAVLEPGQLATRLPTLLAKRGQDSDIPAQEPDPGREIALPQPPRFETGLDAARPDRENTEPSATHLSGTTSANTWLHDRETAWLAGACILIGFALGLAV